MNHFPHATILAIFTFVFLGVPFGLYALLTRDRRKVMHEIRKGALQRGWRYRLRRWQGNPVAFRIDGRTPGGQPWVLTSGNSGNETREWTTLLHLRFPSLRGETDFLFEPRSTKSPDPRLVVPGLPQKAEERLASFSSTISSAAEFFREAEELPSGLASFDAKYRILVLRQRFNRPPVETTLAQRILEWPPETVHPHSLLAWRDTFSVEFLARLPGPPSWETVCYFLELGQELSQRVPSGTIPSTEPTLLDRTIARVLE